MIYTTYFAKLKDLPKDIIPIAICGKSPNSYKGLSYKKLAPKYEFFKQWKVTKDNDYYIKCYVEQVLNKLDADDVVQELFKLARTAVDPDQIVNDIALVCYEKSEDFCHRHLVSTWLNNKAWSSREYVFN